MTDKEYWFWLSNIPEIGLKKMDAILNRFLTPKEVFHKDINYYGNIKELSDADKARIQTSKDEKRIVENYAKLKMKDIYFLTKGDKEYPKKLLNIYQPPCTLYVKGKLPDENKTTIAIVGARNCSDYGREVASYFARELSKYGIQIISGLAKGIDGYAHSGALEIGGSTFGILGCGVDICYPKENFKLYMETQRNGGIISEYGMGFSPRAYNFPMRNRIISGLSDGILVIEAKEKSGSLITVDMGLDQGKNIYAIPGRITDLLGTGCNNLIKIGAKIVTEPSDILEDFNLNCEISEKELKKNDKLLETKEKIVYACVSFFPKHMNAIAGETNIGIVELAEILFQLEMKNYIKQTRNNYYVSVK